METVLVVAEHSRFDEIKKLFALDGFVFIRAESEKSLKMKIFDLSFSFVIVDSIFPNAKELERINGGGDAWLWKRLGAASLSAGKHTVYMTPNGDFTRVDALFLMVAGSLGWLVPVPGGFGAFHFVVSIALSTIYGIPFELGIIFATLSHESQAITMAVCGGGSYLYETLCRRDRKE